MVSVYGRKLGSFWGEYFTNNGGIEVIAEFYLIDFRILWERQVELDSQSRDLSMASAITQQSLPRYYLIRPLLTKPLAILSSDRFYSMGTRIDGAWWHLMTTPTVLYKKDSME